MITSCKIDKTSFRSSFRLRRELSRTGLGTRLLFIVLAFTLVLKAQTVVIDGEIRPRTEYQDGYSKPLTTNNSPGIFTTQRTRLNVNYNTELLKTRISLQDARVFGQDANTSSIGTLGIYEAWADVQLLPRLTLKMGRQAVCLDDNRLFSSPQWSNTGTAHDMGLLKYSSTNWQVQLAAAFNNKSANPSETLYRSGAKYRSLFFLHISKSISKSFKISTIAVDEAWQDTVGIGTNYQKMDMNHGFTLGGNLSFQNEKFPLSALATAYFQVGKNAIGKTLAGKLMAIKLNFKISENVSTSIGTDYLSGDANDDTDGKVQSFKKLYGADHTFNGFMDYWNTPLTTGLLDYYGSVRASITKNLSLESRFHTFNTEYVGQNKKNIAYAKNIGSEFDFIIDYKLNTWTNIQCGYCRYFSNNNTLIAKDIIDSEMTIPDIRSPQWVYVMFTVKPTFLKSAHNP